MSITSYSLRGFQKVLLHTYVVAVSWLLWQTVCSFLKIGMLVHGSKPSLNRRRIGLTAQFCQPSVRFRPMDYTKSIAFTEDFRQPVLVSGRDTFGKLHYVKTKEQMYQDAKQ